jgi:cell division protein FtsW (lipid II flippase)
MNLSRFFLGLAFLILALLAFKFSTDPLTDKNIAATIGEGVGGVMGGLIWGLFIWCPIRLIRGADKAPDIRSFILYAAAIFVAIYIVFHFIVGTPLSEIERLVF